MLHIMEIAALLKLRRGSESEGIAQHNSFGKVFADVMCMQI